MSRIGKKPIAVPENVKIEITGQVLTVEGPLGKLEQWFSPNVTACFDAETRQLVVDKANNTRAASAMHGLYRALFQNMVSGVTAGYEKKLEIFGTGYLFAVAGDSLQIRAGFAHEVHLSIPQGLKVVCPDQMHVSIKGIDKQLVGQVAAEIRSLKKPEPYKGKGIKYSDETIIRKAGKAGKK